MIGWDVPALGAMVPPEHTYADVVERITPALVNISTTKAVLRGQGAPELPFTQPPPGSPFEDFFR
jgi:serine protease Do